MTESADRVLYVSENADRFFVVPRELELPDGDFTVRGLDGRALAAEGASLAPFEVTEDEAREHTRAQVEGSVAAAAKVLSAALGLGRDELTPRRLAELLGIGQAGLTDDPGAARASVEDLVGDVQMVSAAVASGSASDVEAARARLAARGIDLGGTLDDLARQLAAFRELDQQDTANAAAAGLRTLADAIEKPGEQPLGRRIDELIERLEREFAPWLGPDPEQRRVEYRTSARSSIADALREAGIEPLNDSRDAPA